MVTVNVHEAKTQLSKLLEQVERGEEVVIARRGKPVARLVPHRPEPRRPREPGSLKGRLVVGPEFDEPLPQEILDAFEGRGP